MIKKRIKSIDKRVYFAFPFAAIATVFVVVPLILIFVYAFRDPRYGGFTFSNFDRFLDANIWRMIGDSFLLATLATLICLLISYPLALALLKLKRTKAVLVLLFILPMWINTLLRIYAVRMLLFDLLGPTFQLVLIGMVYDFFPFMLLPIYTVLVNTDYAYIEAAQDLGATPLVSLVKVRLPLSAPGIISGCIMVFMPTLSSFIITDVLSNRTITIIGNSIDYWFLRGRIHLGSAYSLVLMLLVAAFMFGASKLTKGKVRVTRV